MDLNIQILEHPLISVIVPAYNSDLFISETINSVIDQTYPSWELIIIDDGSTDNTKQIVNEYCIKYPRIKYLYQHNHGQAAARNRGIINSGGSLIAFLDADDIWLTNKLDIQLKILKKHDADVVFAGANYFSDTFNVTSHPLLQKGILKGKLFFNDLFQRCSIANSSVLVKKEIIQKVGFLDDSDEIRGTEDWDLWLRIARSGYSFFGIETELIKYRIHRNGIHHQLSKMNIGKLKIISKYDTEPQISNNIRKKQYRNITRELINNLSKEGRENCIKPVLINYFKKDPFGLVSNIQKIILPIMPLKVFLYFSNKILYRIGYRLENLYYRLGNY